MPRNGSGTMAIVNSFSPDTTISSAASNANNSDIASEITNSLPRDGQAAMTGPLKAASGTLAAPGIAFGSDTDTGFYRKAGNTIGVVAGGAEVGSIDETGFKDASGTSIAGIPTGAMMMFGAKTAPDGWVRANGRTIGSPTSGAAERADADCEDLFSFLWTNYSDTACPVTGGRGASAAADWASNKVIGLPDWRGRGPFGLDDMGNSAASRLGSVISSPTTNGSTGGAETVTLARANLPNITLALTGQTASGGSHSHSVGNQGSVNREAGGSGSAGPGTDNTSTAGAHSHSLTGDTESLNGNVTQTAVANMPPAFLTTFIIKL